MQEPERYINHSCSPNVNARTFTSRVRYVYALRDIAAGEELTFDYCISSSGDTVWECNCGSRECRKTIHSEFFHLPLSLQIKYMIHLDDWYVEEHREKVEELRSLAEGEEKSLFSDAS